MSSAIYPGSSRFQASPAAQSLPGYSRAAGLRKKGRCPGLDFDARGMAGNFEKEVVEPVRRLAGRTLDWKSAAAGLALPGGINWYLAFAYRRHLFTAKWRLWGEPSLKDLPASPLFVINATNLQSGVLWRFSRPYTRDYRVGEIKTKAIRLSRAVAASSAFPPSSLPLASVSQRAITRRTPGTICNALRSRPGRC